MNINEFARKIKTKYPAYEDIDDSLLVSKFLEKYPVYRNRVDMGRQTKNKVKLSGLAYDLNTLREQVKGREGKFLQSKDQYETVLKNYKQNPSKNKYMEVWKHLKLAQDSYGLYETSIGEYNSKLKKFREIQTAPPGSLEYEPQHIGTEPAIPEYTRKFSENVPLAKSEKEAIKKIKSSGISLKGLGYGALQALKEHKEPLSVIASEFLPKAIGYGGFAIPFSIGLFGRDMLKEVVESAEHNPNTALKFWEHKAKTLPSGTSGRIQAEKMVDYNNKVINLRNQALWGDKKTRSMALSQLDKISMGRFDEKKEYLKVEKRLVKKLKKQINWHKILEEYPEAKTSYIASHMVLGLGEMVATRKILQNAGIKKPPTGVVFALNTAFESSKPVQEKKISTVDAVGSVIKSGILGEFLSAVNLGEDALFKYLAKKGLPSILPSAMAKLATTFGGVYELEKTFGATDSEAFQSAGVATAYQLLGNLRTAKQRANFARNEISKRFRKGKITAYDKLFRKIKTEGTEPKSYELKGKKAKQLLRKIRENTKLSKREKALHDIISENIGAKEQVKLAKRGGTIKVGSKVVKKLQERNLWKKLKGWFGVKPFEPQIESGNTDIVISYGKKGAGGGWGTAKRKGKPPARISGETVKFIEKKDLAGGKEIKRPKSAVDNETYDLVAGKIDDAYNLGIKGDFANLKNLINSLNSYMDLKQFKSLPQDRQSELKSEVKEVEEYLKKSKTAEDFKKFTQVVETKQEFMDNPPETFESNGEIGELSTDGWTDREGYYFSKTNEFLSLEEAFKLKQFREKKGKTPQKTELEVKDIDYSDQKEVTNELKRLNDIHKKALKQLNNKEIKNNEYLDLKREIKKKKNEITTKYNKSKPPKQGKDIKEKKKPVTEDDKATLIEKAGYFKTKQEFLDSQFNIENVSVQKGYGVIGEQEDHKITLIEKDTNNKIGYIDYAIYKNKTQIQMIEVNPDYRGQGYSQMLYNEFQKETGKPLETMGDFKTPEGEGARNKYTQTKKRLEDIWQQIQKQPKEQKKPTPKKVPKGKDEIEKSGREFKVPTGKVSVDLENFQPREGAYSDESLQNMMDNWDDNALDALVLYKHKGKNLVLAGHTRLEVAKRRKDEFVYARFFEGTFEEAKEFADRSNNRGSGNTDTANANSLRKQRKRGDSKSEIEKRAKEDFGKNALVFIEYSYLNPNGQVWKVLKSFNKTTDKQTQREIETIASWIGYIRKTFGDKITNTHEQELFKALQNNKIRKKIRSKQTLRQRIGAIVDNAFYDKSKALNINNIQYKKSGEVYYDNRHSEIKQEMIDIDDDIAKYKEARSLSSNQDDIDIFNKKIKSLEGARKSVQSELIKLQQNKRKIVGRGIYEPSLFDAIDNLTKKESKQWKDGTGTTIDEVRKYENNKTDKKDSGKDVRKKDERQRDKKGGKRDKGGKKPTKATKTKNIIEISEPKNVRGKVTAGNWAVEYKTSLKKGQKALGGKKYNEKTKYFFKKKEALEWIEKNKPTKDTKLPKSELQKKIDEINSRVTDFVRTKSIGLSAGEEKIVKKILNNNNEPTKLTKTERRKKGINEYLTINKDGNATIKEGVRIDVNKYTGDISIEKGISKKTEKIIKKGEQRLSRKAEPTKDTKPKEVSDVGKEETNREKAFKKVSSAQRIDTDAEKLSANSEISGIERGTWTFLLEHTGDIIHRISGGNTTSFARIEDGTGELGVREKVEKSLTRLRNNIDDVNFTKDNKKAVEYGKKVAKEYGKIPVYNRAQWLARESEIAIAKFETKKAIGYLTELETMLNNDTLVEEAGKFTGKVYKGKQPQKKSNLRALSKDEEIPTMRKVKAKLDAQKKKGKLKKSDQELYDKIVRELSKKDPENRKVKLSKDGQKIELHAGVDLTKALTGIGKAFKKLAIPIEIVKEVHGKKVAADLLKYHFKVDNIINEILNKHYTDEVYADLKNLFDHFTHDELAAFVNAYIGDPPKKADGKKIRKEALKKVPKALRNKELRRGINKLKETVDEYRKSVFGDDLESLINYFYGKYKNFDKFDVSLKGHKQFPLPFLHKKTIKSAADASAFGLELVHLNPIRNLEAELRDIAEYSCMKQLFNLYKNTPSVMRKRLPDSLTKILRGNKGSDVNTIIKDGRSELGKRFAKAVKRWYEGSEYYKGKPKTKGTKLLKKRVAKLKEYYLDLLDKQDNLGWKTPKTRIFRNYLVEGSVVRILDNLTQFNAVTQNKFLNFMRKVNKTNQTVKFMGSVFHPVTVSLQSLVTPQFTDILKGAGFKHIMKAWKGIPNSEKESYIYKRYIESGGKGTESLLAQSERAFQRAIAKFDAKFIKLHQEESKKMKKSKELFLEYNPISVDARFIGWMFAKFIPALKYYKFKYEYGIKAQRLGRDLTDAECQDITTEIQNIFGMLNETLFGRSGTVTSVSRLINLAPGYFEGNLWTMYLGLNHMKKTFDVFEEEGFKKGFEYAKEGKGSISARNLIQAWIIGVTLSTIATLILTGKPPAVENFSDIRNLTKVNTGRKDKNGDDIMISWFAPLEDYQTILLEPVLNTMDTQDAEKITDLKEPGSGLDMIATYVDELRGNVWKRIVGLQNDVFGFMGDMLNIARGKSIYDWKDDKVVTVSKDVSQWLQILSYEAMRLTPFSVNSYEHWRHKDVSAYEALVYSMAGLRAGRTEKQREKYDIIYKIKDLDKSKGNIYAKIMSKYTEDPRAVIDEYNDVLDKARNSIVLQRHLSRENPIMTADEINKTFEELRLDPDNYLQNRAQTLANDIATFYGEETKKNKRAVETNLDILSRFGINSVDGIVDKLIEKTNRVDKNGNQILSFKTARNKLRYIYDFANKHKDLLKKYGITKKEQQ